MEVLETHIAGAERLADAAENRADVAERWLSKFHGTTIDELQRTSASRHGERRRAASQTEAPRRDLLA